ncbi:MAG TPA: DnaB-like helicase C-terminal domain-containing protein [Nitrolancea sp.]|nr:DnaB-like helicase C-terminal domain-containing protein [Nitrolancea sp.]
MATTTRRPDYVQAVEKLLPQNMEAEAGVLGSLLIDPSAIMQVADFLKPADFYSEAHRVIYAAALDLYEAQEPADLLTLCDELSRRGKLEEVGGASFVSSLANQVPTSRNVKHYAQIVVRCATLRDLIDASGQIAGVAYSEPDAETATEFAVKTVLGIQQRRGVGMASSGRDRSFSEILDELGAETLSRMEADAPTGVLTGLLGLDRLTLGIEPGELVYCAGRPGSGKSALGLGVGVNAARALARSGRPGSVYVVTLEMSARAQARRLVAAAANLNSRYIRAGFRAPGEEPDLEAWTAFDEKREQLKREVGERLWWTEGSVSIAQLRARVMAAVLERGCRLVIIDQLDLMADSGGQAGEFERITQLSRQLRQIASTYGVAIWCMVQLNRQVEQRANKRPQLSDLRQSGQLEQDADLVLGIFRPAYYDPERAGKDPRFAQYAKLCVLKARDGESGVEVHLRFEKEHTRFTDWPYETTPQLSGE